MLPVNHQHAHPDLTFGPLTLMWLVMMTTMMAPTVWPWARTFHRFAGGSSRATAAFVGGYLIAWAGYALAASTAQIRLQDLQILETASGRLGPWSGAAVLGIAGLYQLAPFKRTCLTHCRNPVTYFLTRWRAGPAGGFRIGLAHGAYCVGCCWALMGTAFAVGVMSPWWMGLLTAVVFIEQMSPWHSWLRIPIGVALLFGGLARL